MEASDQLHAAATLPPEKVPWCIGVRSDPEPVWIIWNTEKSLAHATY
jgi:hypothetical protein